MQKISDPENIRLILSQKVQWQQFQQLLVQQLEKTTLENISYLHLGLENQYWTQNSLSELFSSLSYFKNLQKLNLKLILNEFNLNNLLLKVSIFEQLRSLSLDISDQTIATEHIVSFSSILYASQCSIQSQGLICICLSLSQMQQLAELKLNFRKNELDGDGIEQLAKLIPHLNKIENLELNFDSNPQIHQKIHHQLRESLSQINKIQHLALNFSNIPMENEIEPYFNVISRFNQLEFLSLKLKKGKLKSYNNNFLKFIKLSHLSNLKILSFQYMTRLGGSDQFSSFFSELQQLEQLTTLNLDFSQSLMTQKCQKSISAAFSTLSNLSSVKLKFQNFLSDFSDENDFLDFLIEHFTQLKAYSLNLSHNNIGYKHLQSFSSKLAKMQNLTDLSLKFENSTIYSQGVEYITSSLSQLHKLQTLSLSLKRSNIHDEGMKYISSALGKLEMLSTLNLDAEENKITPLGARYLFSEILGKKYSSLEINLKKNNISYENDKTNVYLQLSSNQSLLTSLELNFEDNQISIKGITSFSEGLKHLKLLRYLSLSLQNNGIGKEGAQILSSALSVLKKIIKVDLKLYENNILNEGVEYLCRAFIEMDCLTVLYLDLFCNNINDEGIAIASQQLSQIKNLSCLKLDLKFNKIKEEGYYHLIQFLKTSAKKLVNVSLYVDKSSSEINILLQKEINKISNNNY